MRAHGSHGGQCLSVLPCSVLVEGGQAALDFSYGLHDLLAASRVGGRFELPLKLYAGEPQ